MSYLPPTVTPASAPARRRRTARKVTLRKRPKKRRKTGKRIPLWQFLVLAALCVGLVFAAFQWNRADASLRQLREERAAAREEYIKTVARHEVKYRDYIEEYAAQYSLNPAYVSAIIMQESAYNPKAVSSKGAMGLMQFMPDTFDWVAPNCGISKNDTNAVYEPEKAIKMGCYLLNYIVKKLGTDDPILVACAYHAGWGTVPAWIANYSTDGKTLTVDQIPKADTRTYAGRVLNSYAIYLQHYY